MTFAPSSTKRRALARPRLPAPPVTMHTLSCSCPMYRSLERVVHRRGRDRDPAKISEFGDACIAAEAAVTRRLHAAEWHLCLVVHCWAIDVAHARVDATRDIHGARDIAAENC